MVKWCVAAERFCFEPPHLQYFSLHFSDVQEEKTGPNLDSLEMPLQVHTCYNLWKLKGRKATLMYELF